MESIRRVIHQLTQVWNQASVVGRVVFLATAAASLALVAGVGVWSSRPQYVTLASDLDPARAAEIVSKLETGGISHRMNFSGSSILVPKNQWNQGRLLAGEQLASPHVENLALNDSLIGDPQTSKFKLLRQREQRLARTIMKMPAVQTAVVHIGMAPQTPFARDRQPTTASVVIDVHQGGYMSKEQAASIVAVVAGSIEGLKQEAVTVMDTAGRILSSNATLADGEISAQYEYRRDLESHLASKAEIMLAHWLGQDRAMVRVTADIDFTRRKTIEKTPDSERRVVKSETNSTTKQTGTERLAFGPAGTDSNLGGATGASGVAPTLSTTENIQSEYVVGETIDTTEEARGKLKRLTIAVMVDLSEAVEGEAASPVTKEQVSGIVKQAVGLDETRGDQIEVLVTKLAGIHPGIDQELLQLKKWDFYRDLARNSSLGLAAITSLLIAMLILRKFNSPSTSVDQEEILKRERVVTRLAAEARANPDALAKIISAWLNDAGTIGGSKTDQKDDTEPTVTFARRAA